MALESPPFAFQSGSYVAEQARRAIFSTYARTTANTPGVIQGGVLSPTDCVVTPASSGLSVNVSTGEMLIPGTESASQGGYYCLAPSVTNVPLAAANPTDPRIDYICAIASDGQYGNPTGGTAGQAVIAAISGTPTAGATLGNLSGAPTQPLSSLLLGAVLVGAGVSSLSGADVVSVGQVAGQLASLHHAGDYPGNLISKALYAPTTEATYSIGSTLAPLDIGNLTVAFVVPPSGCATVRLSGFGVCNAGAVQWWGLVEHDTSAQMGPAQVALDAFGWPSGSNAQGCVTMDIDLSGLSPGQVVQADWAAVASGTSSVFAQDANPRNTSGQGPAVMKVYAA